LERGSLLPLWLPIQPKEEEKLFQQSDEVPDWAFFYTVTISSIGQTDGHQ
jgi:hypothetical protein